MLEKLSLDGKVIIVTGGGTGLGRAMVMAVARAGADLVIAGRREGPIGEAASEVEKLGRRAVAVSTDVRESRQVDRMVALGMERFGRTDVLINNAGRTSENVHAPIWEISDEEWKVGIDTNLTGAFYCARAVARHMVDRGRGKIINVASGFGLRGGRDLYSYTCSKGGMIQLTRTLAMSLGRHGVTANTIVPGFIPTRGTESMRDSLPRSGEFIPTGRLGRPEDIGPIAVFLASDASDYMNGEMITLDGGGLAGGLAPTGYAPTIPLDTW
jgi:NAD(P)-dependent dehydrogenase (short-subunit alcohol dehydrogenase family)